MTIRDVLAYAAPFLVGAALVFGPATAWLAARRHRNPALWLLYGAVTGPLAMVVMLLAPPGRCPACWETTSGFASTCWTCGANMRLTPRRPPGRATPDLDPTSRNEAPLLGTGGRTQLAAGTGRVLGEHSIGALSERLEAVGARRPSGAGSSDLADPSLRGPDMTVLAIGVFVRGSEPLLPGARYLIARNVDRLMIIGPVEPSTHHIELDLPIAGVEANFVPDRLVISGWHEGKAGRRFVLAFQSLAGLTATAIDEVLMSTQQPSLMAAHRS